MLSRHKPRAQARANLRSATARICRPCPLCSALQRSHASYACICNLHLACAHHTCLHARYRHRLNESARLSNMNGVCCLSRIACLNARYKHRLIDCARLSNVNGRVLSVQDRSGMAKELRIPIRNTRRAACETAGGIPPPQC